MHCLIIAALTADGFIGRDVAHKSTRWTSKADAAWFNQRSQQAGAVVMGRATHDTIGKPLPDRVTIVYSRHAQKNLVQDQPELMKGQVYYTQAQPKELLAQLKKLGVNEVAVSGGSSIYTMFLRAGVVQTLYLTIEPVIFGQGIRLFNHKLAEKINQLKLISVKKLSPQTLLLEYGLS